MQPNKTCHVCKNFSDDFNFQSIGVGIILLSHDFKVFYKNSFSERYLKLPRKNADFLKSVLNKSSFKSALSLSEQCGSFCVVCFKPSHPITKGILVRLHDQSIALILHTSMSVLEILCANYSEDNLRVIASCITRLYERKSSDRYVKSGKNPFFLNSEYLAERHTVMRLLSLSEGISLIKSALEELNLKTSTKILFSNAAMTPYKFVDVALLAYAASELIETSRIYSKGSPIKLEIDVSGCTATVKASGSMKISSFAKGRLFENGVTNLRLLLVSGAFASMGINLIPVFANGKFELTSVIPLADKTFESFRLSTVLAKQFYISLIIKQVFFTEDI